MANWVQQGRNGEHVKRVSGRAFGGLFGVVKRAGLGDWQIDHLPSGFVVERMRGLDYKLHVRVASELNKLVQKRYPDPVENPWLFAGMPVRAVLVRMRQDLDEVKARVLGY